jgi:epsilon-lactone hydrolase
VRDPRPHPAHDNKTARTHGLTNALLSARGVSYARAAMTAIRSSLSPEARTTIEELRVLRAVDAALDLRRAAWEARAEATALPPGTELQRVMIARTSAGGGNVPAEFVRAGHIVPEACVLLLHGGGYVSGNCVTHREMAARLSLGTRARVLVVDYRRAPEHPFPAAIEDCVDAYKHLLHEGFAPDRIAVIGDSAGGGLTAALLLQARDLGLPLPRAAVLLSPWLDLLIESPSGTRNAAADPSIVRERLLVCAQQYLNGADARHPLASPLHADPRGLPPLYINVGDQEVLLDDALIFARRAREAGVDVTLSIGAGLWHVYPAWAGAVPEAAEELSRVSRFISDRLATPPLKP